MLGRFGINIEKAITEVMSTKRFKEIAPVYKVNNHIYISDQVVLVTYTPKLDPDMISNHGLDFMSALNKYTDNEIFGVNNTSVAISAAVTAYARIHITKIKLYILSQGGEIYYSDTDSIVTNVKLPDDMISEN